MMRHVAAALAFSLSAIVLSATFARSENTKASSNTVSIELPGDLNYRFKSGPGSDRANTYCLTCHSSAYVSTQPPLDRDHWVAEVTKMRKAYHAEIPDKDVDVIADYLTREYGKP
jgi:hypothetical protein